MLPRIWTQQPRGVVPFNPKYPTPTFAFNAAVGVLDLVKQAAITRTNVTIAPTPHGISYTTPSVGVNDGFYVASSLAAQTTPFSVMLIVKPGTSAATIGLFQWAGTSGSSGTPHALIQNNSTNLRIYGSASGYVATQNGALPAGSLRTIVLTYDGTNAYLSCNGVETSAATPWGVQTKTHFWIGNGYLNLATSQGILAASVWNGVALNRAVAKNLSLNGWDIFAPLPDLIFAAVDAAGSTGTVAYTNANDTSAANGTTTVTGELAATNANDTCSASGSVGNSVSGSVSYTNENDTSAASGTTTVTGSLARTNANDSCTASGTTTVVGTLATTNANDTSAASGVSGAITGTVAYTNANDVCSASGTAGTVQSNSSGGWNDYGEQIRRRSKTEYEPTEVETHAADVISPIKQAAPDDAETLQAEAAQVSKELKLSIAAVKALADDLQQQENISALVVDQMQSEQAAISAQLHAELMQQQIEELDVVFVIMSLAAIV